MEKEYKNNEIRIHWKPDLCTHSGICARGLASVFKPSERPWVDPLGATTQQIIDQVKQCPSGALTYTFLSDMVAEPANQDSVKVSFINNGPVLIKGACVVQMPDGTEVIKEKGASFCRCGQSANYPFCDGTHKRIA
jgi:uncharacterized Fe-S cluster protein YjdI